MSQKNSSTQIAHLPTPTTSFVGRSEELARIRDLLANPHCHLLTIIGPGGIGKTRLALRAAADQISNFLDGISFVPLAGVGSSDLIAAAIANALPISLSGAEDLRERMIRYLRRNRMLLLLDNLEHLLSGVDLLVDVIQVAPDVKLIVTSRERLNVQEEWAVILGGLTVPAKDATASMDSYSAVELFVERARQVQTNFALDAEAEAVQTICQRVEGMPLGLELAASWLRAMTCQQIAAHMDSSLDFLTTPLRNVPERHRSLRVMFEQSWQLLSMDEQSVLMKLAIFRGGFDLEAAEAVAGASLSMLEGLADKSLIRLNVGGRYDLQVLLRQFAEDKLQASGDASFTSHQHLSYFVKLAEQAEAHIWGRAQSLWLDRLDMEMDNLRAALAWSITAGEVESGLRLASALGWFFQYRRRRGEGWNWLRQLLALPSAADAHVRAKALNWAGALACVVGDDQGEALLTEALVLARQTNDDWTVAWALANLGWRFYDTTVDAQEMLALEQESLALFRKLGDPEGVSHLLRRCAHWATYVGEYAYARSLLEEALSGGRVVGDGNTTAWVLLMLACAIWRQEHDAEQSAKLLRESAAQFEEIKDISEAHYPLTLLAQLEQIMGNEAEARFLYEKAVGIAAETDNFQDPVYPPLLMVGLGSLAGSAGKPERAARLLAAGESGIPGHCGFFSRSDFDRAMVSVRAQLGEAAFAQAWAAGKAMTRDQVLAYLLEGRTTAIETTPVHQATHPCLAESLSPRELEVLCLLAEGLSNREIAQKLYIAIATVKVHTGNIYGKLGVTNRTQAVTQAQKLNLI